MAKTATKKTGPTSAPKKKPQASPPHPSYFQLRNLTSKRKLVKVKASFKLSPSEKHVAKKMEKIAKPKVAAGKTNVVAKKGTKVKKLKSSAPARPAKKAAPAKPKSIKSPAAKNARKPAA